MTPDDLLDDLRRLELELRSAPVQRFFERRDEVTRARFVSLRQDVTVLLGRLTNAELSRVSAKLEGLEDELRAGTSRLRACLTELDDAAAILDALGSVLGVAARIAQLAG